MDYEIKFWKDWLEGDLLKREKLVKNLPFVSRVIELSKDKRIEERMKKETITMQLNAFFEDLESAVYTKIQLDKTKTFK